MPKKDAEIKKVLIMAGGTGGHVFPALAVAEALRENDIEVHWLGTVDGIEADIVSSAGFHLSKINIHGFRGMGMWKKLKSLLELAWASLRALQILLREKPDLVIGMGGYVSAPGGFVAWLLRKPLVIHEQNSRVGLSNRLLAPIAKKVLQAFPDTFAAKWCPETTGNPLRSNLYNIDLPTKRYNARTGPLHILILGGSQGASFLNETIPKVLQQWPQDMPWPEIWHQSGKNHLEATRHYYDEVTHDVKVDAFIGDMSKAYQWADLIICRAGALTVSEIIAVGVAAIFIPYPHAIDDHQTTNANFLVTAGAGILIPQKDFDLAMLKQYLIQYSSNRSQLLSQAEKARQLCLGNATEKVVEVVKKTVL